MAVWKKEEIASRIGINSESLTTSGVFGETEMGRMVQAGIRRLELHPLHFTYCKDQQRRNIVAASRKYGVTVPSVHLPICPFDSEDDKVRKRAVREGVLAARFGHEVGATICVAHFGVSAQSRKSACEMLDQLQDLPIRLVTENVRERDLRELMAFVDDIGSDRLAMVVDIGHLRDDDGVNPFFKKDKARSILAQCGERIAHVHLHGAHHIIDHIPPFAGNMQWGEVFKALKDIDYQGTFLFEYIPQSGTPEPDPDLLDREDVQYFLWCKRQGKGAGKTEDLQKFPSKEALYKMIQETPPEIVQRALRETPREMDASRTEPDSATTPEERLRDELERITREGGNLGRQIIRYSLAAPTDELLKATSTFPEEYAKRY